MTALDRYVRLEALGLWREAPGADPREVVVSFGTATLVLTDLAEHPLGHWALAGVSVLGQDGGATVYSMTADGAETLAIRDPEMITAIAAVSRRQRGPAPLPRRRLPLGPILGLAALAALLAAAPRLIRSEVVRLVPAEEATELGDRMLIALIERHGPPCGAPEGERALGRLAARLDPADPPRLRVMRLGGSPVAALPGRTLLVDRDALAAAGSADEVTGWIATGLVIDPVAALVDEAGPLADLRYVFTGTFTDATLARAAEAALAPPAPGESAEAPARRGAAVPDSGASRAPDASSLASSDWLALRGICR